MNSNPTFGRTGRLKKRENTQVLLVDILIFLAVKKLDSKSLVK